MLNHYAFTAMLIANSGVSPNGTERMDQISDAFAQSTVDWSTFRGWAYLAGCILSLAGTTAVTTYLKLRDDRRHGPCARHLARRAGLGFTQWVWLNSIARRQGYLNASGMLLSRGTFDHVARSVSMGGGGTARAVRRLDAIRRLIHDNQA